MAKHDRIRQEAYERTAKYRGEMITLLSKCDQQHSPNRTPESWAECMLFQRLRTVIDLTEVTMKDLRK